MGIAWGGVLQSYVQKRRMNKSKESRLLIDIPFGRDRGEAFFDVVKSLNREINTEIEKVSTKPDSDP